MVPVKEAINSGSWLHCEYEEYKGIIKFRLKVDSFRKLSFSEIDNPEEMEYLLNPHATLWLMSVDFINLTSIPIDPYYGPKYLMLIDKDGFNFPVRRSDSHLERFSNFAEISGVNKFYSEGDLIPKIKVVGSLIFELPDDDEAEYSISIKNDGIVQEV